ncbi:MAG: FAD:protein FMN transferase, partial [Acidobacteriaceae bacterium]
RLPSRAEVDSVLPKVGYRHVALDAESQTVRFDCAGVELDPGGIGKGYAVDCMVDELRRRGFRTAFVAASDSTMVGMGAPPEEPRGWRVGIKDPRNRRLTVDEVFLRDASLSTSGISEKFFRAEGRVYSHIMDPRTGFPAEASGSVSVVAPHAIDSEAWAKPYFIHGREWTERHMPEEFRVCFCDGGTDEPCAWFP